MKKRKVKKAVKSRPTRRKHVHKGIFCSCRGGISPKIIIIGAIIIIALAAGGYFMFTGKNTSGGGLIEKISNETQKTAMQKLVEESMKYIKDPILRKHYIAEAETKKRRIKMPQGSVPGAVQVMEMEMTGDGTNLFDFKANQSIWTEINGQKKAEYIVIGDTTYVKDYKDNKWWKQTKKPEKLDDKISPLPKEEDYSNKIKEVIPTGPEPKEPKKIGEEKCPNAPSLTCYKYQDTDDSMKEFSGSEFTRIFWFDNQNFLLRKDQSGSGENASWSEYEYDNINITPPSPTKDIPAGRDIGEYMLQSMQSANGEPAELPDFEKLKSEMKNFQQSDGNYQAPVDSNNQPAQNNTSEDGSDTNVEN